MKAEVRFDVYEVELNNPGNRRLMRGDMSEMDAEAFTKMAVMRRGVSTHCFVMEPTEFCNEGNDQ